ncbi:hypothetical protein MMC25_002868 [Agyrium rufum]|nr:hypothetical protein [Agyrium rufum]
MSEPFYLGLDLSTQQLKGVVVTSDLKVQAVAKFDFDAESHGYDIKKGVMTNESDHEVFAPVALWLSAVDGVLQKLQRSGIEFSRIRGISGAGQQHGSVYWSRHGEKVLGNLDAGKNLEIQLDHAFSHPYSPNWQDASTQQECEAFDKELGDEYELSHSTGSKAHHRFTGPQILRFQKRNREAYNKTSRISLVSSFLASIFLGKIASIDISDVCGMNLWDIKSGNWNEKLIALTSGPENTADLLGKLGKVPEDGGANLGTISSYFVQRYGFHKSCTILPFTGDNPSTILALPLRSSDAMVSLGTSTTFLMSTPRYKPDPAMHFFNHPTTPGLYMFMLCYKNGGLAREKIRDAINDGKDQGSWKAFDRIARTSPVLGQAEHAATIKMGLYFPRPEIVPNVRAGEWRFLYNRTTQQINPSGSEWTKPEDDARAIIESQMLSLRLRSKDLVESPGNGLPAQPRRIYLVGGGSRNATIAKIAGEVLGGVEGVYKLDVGENACALGAAYKAVWALEREPGQAFEDLIGARWKEEDFIERIADGYQKDVFDKYGEALLGFEMMEKKILEGEKAK